MRTVQATAFIDWDCARRIVRPDTASRSVRKLDREKRAIHALQRSLASNIASRDSRTIFQVSMRIYHGWYRGKTKTPDRRDLERLSANAELLLRKVDRVAFVPDLFCSDHLLCDGQRKLWDTLRKRDDGVDEQKMVDTALISDLLHFVRHNREALAIVVGDDDDLLPGIFTAAAWGAQVMLARVARENDNPHIDISKYVCRLEGV